MTDREKAIVMAYMGVAMLTGDKLDEYYKYCSELLGHPAYTHEVFSKDISERAKNDFIKLCKIDEQPTADVQEVKHGHWERTKDGAARCTACGRKMNPYLYGYLHCAMCGAIMDERGKK